MVERARCICAGTGCGHLLESRAQPLSRIGIELDPQVSRSEGTRSNVRLKEVLPIVGVDSNAVETHSAPMPLKVLLPLEQTRSDRTIIRCTIAIAQRRRKIMTQIGRASCRERV